MRYLLFFFVAAVCTFGFQSFTDTTSGAAGIPAPLTIAADSCSINGVMLDEPIIVSLDNTADGITASELVRYLIDIIGGIVATVLIAWLTKKFPSIFSGKSNQNFYNKN